MLTWWPQSWLGDWVSHIGPWSQAHLKSGRTRNSLHGWPKKNTGIPSNSEKHLNFCLQSNGILILVDVWIWITNPEISVSKHPFFWETSFFIWWILHPGEIETDVMPWADTPWRDIALTALFRVHGCYCQVSDLLQRIHSAGSWRAELRRILLTFKRFDLTNCSW
jgi:hypothetical protein